MVSSLIVACALNIIVHTLAPTLDPHCIRPVAFFLSESPLLMFNNSNIYDGEFVDCCVCILLCLHPRNNLTLLPSHLHTLLAFPLSESLIILLVVALLIREIVCSISQYYLLRSPVSI